MPWMLKLAEIKCLNWKMLIGKIDSVVFFSGHIFLDAIKQLSFIKLHSFCATLLPVQNILLALLGT